jgi:glycosyltransferase 2 family protein
VHELSARTTRPHRVRSTALLTISAGVSALFAYLAIRDVSFEEVFESLRGRQYWLLLPSVLLLAAAIVIRGIRWWVLFAVESRPPLKPVLSSTWIGYFFNNILPLRAGEAARVVSLHQLTQTSRAEAAATVVLERVYDLLSLLVLLFVTLPWLPDVTWLRSAAILAIGLAFALGVSIVLLAVFGERVLQLATAPLRRLPRLSNRRVDQIALRLAEGLAGLRSPRIALAAFLLTLLSWVLLGLSAWLVLVLFDFGLSPVDGVFVMIAVGLAMILPSSPAAVGVFEGATVIALGAYGISNAEALSCALVLHLVNFVPFIVVGLVILLYQARAVRKKRLAMSALVRPTPHGNGQSGAGVS